VYRSQGAEASTGRKKDKKSAGDRSHLNVGTQREISKLI